MIPGGFNESAAAEQTPDDSFRGERAGCDNSVVSRPLITPDLTTAYMTQSIMPQHANTLNITFGGQVMSWMEQCAYISASRMRAPHILTASMDSVTFDKTSRVGDILYFTSQVREFRGA